MTHPYTISFGVPWETKTQESDKCKKNKCAYLIQQFLLCVWLTGKFHQSKRQILRHIRFKFLSCDVITQLFLLALALALAQMKLYFSEFVKVVSASVRLHYICKKECRADHVILRAQATGSCWSKYLS